MKTTKHLLPLISTGFITIVTLGYYGYNRYIYINQNQPVAQFNETGLSFEYNASMAYSFEKIDKWNQWDMRGKTITIVIEELTKPSTAEIEAIKSEVNNYKKTTTLKHSIVMEACLEG